MGDDEITVNAEEVAKVEQEIAQKEAAQNADTEKNVEERVRSEMKQEQELNALKQDLAAKEKALQDLQKAQEEAKSESDKLVKAEVQRRVQEQVATTKAQRVSVNPLNAQEPKRDFSVQPEDVKSIEEASMDAFFSRERK